MVITIQSLTDEDSDLHDTILLWIDKNDSISNTYLMTNILCYGVIGIGALVAVMVAVMIRRRTECFIVITSCFFLVYSFLSLPYNYFAYKFEYN